MAELNKQTTIGQAQRPDHAFLAQQLKQTPDALAKQYDEMFSGVDYGFGAPAGLGMDSSVSGALQSRLQGQLGDRLSLIKGDLLRNRYGDFSKRSGQAQQVSDSEMDTIRLQEQIQAAKEAAKKAKKRGLQSALLGTAGAGAGAYFGGPAGAAIGGGLGTSIGSTI